MKGSIPLRLAAILWLASAAAGAGAQEGLSLREALELALRQNPSVEAAEASGEAAGARSTAARARLLPRVDYIESATRGNNPIYVFGGLLTQERFAERNFAVDALNRPDPLNLHRSQLALEQTLFDPDALGSFRQARVASRIAFESERAARMRVLFATAAAYYGVQVSAARLETVRHALATAGEDLDRAKALREAGLVTEADLLSMQVQLASFKEREIRARNELAIARAELNRVLGESLSSERALSDRLLPRPSSGEVGAGRLDALEAEALAQRPEARQMALEQERMRIGRQTARAAFLPSVSLQAGWESDRVSFTGAGGNNWLVGLSLRWNVFNGLGDRARAMEADALLRKARAERRQQEDAIRIEVRRAALERDAAAESVAVARESVGQARESLRIIQARYETGISALTELLRGEDALLEAELRFLTAVYQERLAEVALELAKGTLHFESEVWKP